MRKFLSLVLASFFLVTYVSLAHAASLTVTSIGSLDTSGTFYPSWWYTKENPTLSGTAVAGSTVTVDIDTKATNTTANASGVWSLTPTTLTAGEHLVTVMSGSETVSFKLAIGNDVPASSATQSATPSATLPQTLPDAGFGGYTIALLVFGLVAVGFGGYTFIFTKG
ncbi:hypothetical protein IPM62_01845 [Candidatus Woesebacteria bacterium]|nr:MAG: hypothetical protein IPM62_01845 [Candidatus Woesebacteria bacterium]